MTVKIGIIGAGRRVHDMYSPVLSRAHQKGELEVVGFWNRDAAKGQLLTDAFGYQRYADEKELVSKCDALIVAVNSNALTTVTLDLMKHQKPLLMETPVWAKEVPQYADHMKVSVAVAEQTPWLPSEQLKMMLLARQDIFGKPHTVVNDFRTFEYHGLAQLRRYIGFDKTPFEVCGMSRSAPMAPFKDGNGVPQRGHAENWDMGQVRFDSGEIAVYNFSSLYNRCAWRKPRSLRIYTDRATISNDDNAITILAGNDVELRNFRFLKEIRPDGQVNRLEVELEGEKIASWETPDRSLTDQQVALKSIVDNFVEHVGKGAKLLYDVHQGWTDMNLLMAIRHSGAAKTYIRR